MPFVKRHLRQGYPTEGQNCPAVGSSVERSKLRKVYKLRTRGGCKEFSRIKNVVGVVKSGTRMFE